MGSAQGKRVRQGEGGLGPLSREEDKQSTTSMEGGNMEQEEEGRTGWA
jgi:hypothetical protein